MVYVTGDCHAEWSKFAHLNFKAQAEMTRDDYVIVCGDFGIWEDNQSERWWFNWLEAKKFTLLFVDGNHENFDRLYSDEFEVVDFHGGKAHKIRDNVYHLMRGYVFTLCGKRFFAFGGARSHDIDDGVLDIGEFTGYKSMIDAYNRRTLQGQRLRINHISWWKEEMPSDEEMAFGLKTLAENNNEVDFIISHCCPQDVVNAYFAGRAGSDKLTLYFDQVAETVKFTKWYCGHYHTNTQIFGKYVMLYDKIIRIV